MPPALDDGFSDNLKHCDHCGRYYDPRSRTKACPHIDTDASIQRAMLARDAVRTYLIESQVIEVLKKCEVSTRPGEL